MPHTQQSTCPHFLEPAPVTSDRPGVVSACVPVHLRSSGFLVGFGCAVVLLTAWHLEPAYLPLGPASQLSFPACAFRQRTGYPCPTCGMTTAWAKAARGDLMGAFRANIAGAILALAAFLGLLFGLATAVFGRPFYLRIVAPVLALLRPMTWLYTLLALIAFAWAWNALWACLAQHGTGA